MAKTTNTTGIIAAAAENKPAELSSKARALVMKDYINRYKNEITRALPSMITEERFSRMVMTAITQVPKLAACSPQTFIGSMITAAQLGLEPNTPLGQAYLIPYESKKTGEVTCQFQLGYKGLIELFYRSGEVKNIEARTVYENDVFEYEFGLEPKLIHKPAVANKGAAVWYYAVYHLKNGGFAFEIMSRQDAEEHAKKYSKSYYKGPWQDNFDEMAKKTVIKRLLRYAPVKTEYVSALLADDKVNNITFDDENEINIIPEDVIDEDEIIDQS